LQARIADYVTDDAGRPLNGVAAREGDQYLMGHARHQGD
jgi:hypothetical protein